DDKVNFVLSPWSTGFIYAAAPIANKYHYILVGGSGGALELSKVMPQLPYYFQVLNYSNTQLPALAAIYKELGLKTVAIAYQENQNGVEYNQEAQKVFPANGLDIVMDKSYVPDSKDLTPLLQAAKASKADAFVGFSYPNDCITLTKEAMANNINFKAFFLEVFPYSPVYRDMFGARAVEGVMGGGAWSLKSPGGAEFAALYQKYYHKGPEDYWGQLYYYASLQDLQKAIEDAGTLDQSKIRDLLATKTYDTIIGPFHYDKDRRFTGFFGQIGQWQHGTWEVVDPGPYRTAPPEIKPPWPEGK
ncbi:MAG: ABC transporter substrate-binding protein, partial [Candidatus Methanomethyliaceae archaeon]